MQVEKSEQSRIPPDGSVRIDPGFVRTLAGICIILEIALGLLVWCLVVATPYKLQSSPGWVVFVSVFFWILTIFVFIVNFFCLYMRHGRRSWTIVEIVFNVSAVIFYFSAAIVEATFASMFAKTMTGHHVTAAVSCSLLDNLSGNLSRSLTCV
uniref:CKLF like MARVEL transmembrane domain containing 8 n=1 Tax=Eptatretus burgeri TaxID=7764 RepID=A0A8C4R5U1_EPTBU